MSKNKNNSSRYLAVFFLFCFVFFGYCGISFSGTDVELAKLQESLQTAYRNYVNASTQSGVDSQEAKFWFDKYQEFAKEYNERTGGTKTLAPADESRQAASGGSGISSKPNIFKKIGYQFLERLKVLLQKVPSHVNDFALGEMNFVTGNYKDALTLYEMAQRKGEMYGIYYYQSIYWQGRCYLEMAKTAGTAAEKKALYEKARQKFENVSMNLLLKRFPNATDRQYEKDSTSLVVQIMRFIPTIQDGGAQQNNNQPDIQSGMNDNSWKTDLRYDYLISDSAFVDTKSMTRDQVQSLLASKNSVLSRPVDGRYPADMIMESASKYGISPKVLLARLQTEQGLVTKKSASQKELDWALGCGAYDGGNWNTKYQGLANQIDGGAQTMRNHYNKGLAKIAENGSIDKTIDGETINIKNAATYSQYMYTPHKAGNKLYRSVYVGFFE